MAEGSSNNEIVKVGNSSVLHYSNALIRRAIEEIRLKSKRIFSVSSLKKEILVIGYPGEIGLLISEWLRSEGFNPSLNESMEYEAPFDKIFAQLSEKQYDLVIITYWAYYRILPEIHKRFSNIKIIFFNSYSSDLDSFAQQHGVNDILRMPFEWDDLISRIKNIFSA